MGEIGQGQKNVQRGDLLSAFSATIGTGRPTAPCAASDRRPPGAIPAGRCLLDIPRRFITLKATVHGRERGRRRFSPAALIARRSGTTKISSVPPPRCLAC